MASNAPKTFLQHRITPPVPRADTTPRPRLVEQFRQALEYRLTLVTAAAGFGKSTLLAEGAANLVETQSQQVAFLSLTGEEDDHLILTAGLLAALKHIYTGLGRVTEAMLEQPEAWNPAALLTPLLNDIAALNSDVVLILDDVHEDHRSNLCIQYNQHR